MVRYNIVVTIKRGNHAPYTYNHNNQPIRPGKVEKVFRDAVENVTSQVTRGGKHDIKVYEMPTMFFARSGGVVIFIRSSKVLQEK